MRGGFIWDDDYYVTENETLHSVNGLKRIWTEKGAVPQYYPLVHTFFWIEYHLWGLNPLGYHINNVLLHGLNSILLFLILKKWAFPGAWMMAVLFAVHPVHVESVAWVTERKNVLSGFFYLCAMHFGIRTFGLINLKQYASQWMDYLCAMVFYIFALLSKTVTCSLPAVLLLLIWWKRGRILRREVFSVIPFLIIGIVLSITTISMEVNHVGASGKDFDWTFLQRCLIAGRALWFYTGKLLFPYPLSFIYYRWELDHGLTTQLFYPLGVLFIVGALFFLRHKIGRGPLVGVLFFIGTLFPALGFINVYPMRYSFVADHFQYLASIGMIVLFIGWVLQFFRSFRLSSVYLTRFLGLIVVFIFGILTWQQGYAYSDRESLWRDTIRKNPKAWMAYNNLGEIVLGDGQIDEAIGYYKKAIKLRPDYPEAYYNLANAIGRTGAYKEAIRLHHKALVLDPRFIKVHLNLANSYALDRQAKKAIKHYQVLLSYEPQNLDALCNMAIVLETDGQIQQAITNYRRILALDPEHEKASRRLSGLLLNVPKVSVE